MEGQTVRSAGPIGDVGDLWARYRGHRDPEARALLLDGYLGLVYRAAWELTSRDASKPLFDDLVGAGTVGLIDALERFEPARGLAFSTFAMPRIRGAMLDELRAETRMTRSSRRRWRLMSRVREDLQQRLGGPPQPHEMAEALNVSLGTYWKWIQEADPHRFLALDPSPADSTRARSPLAEVVADRGQPPDASLVQEESRQALREALTALPDRERLVLTLSFYEGLTLRDIGRVVGVTESRVSQIRSRALRQLRSRLDEVERP